MMSYFSQANTTYIDACLGVALTSWQAVASEFSTFTKLPAAAISYPLRIVGDTRSAAIEFVDAPAFFKQEIRALSSVTFDSSHKIMPGETILITGGAGMVGQAATAIARWRGAEPIVADRHRPDGVEHFIDTSSSDIREAVLELTDGRGADLALDTAGGALFEPALRSLRFDAELVR